MMSWSLNSAAHALFAVSVSLMQGGPTMDALFEKAVNSTGAEYLAAEEALRKRGAIDQTALRDQRQNPDPVARLIAEVIVGWQADAATYQDVLDFLENLAGRFSRTPVSMPPPAGVAGTLSDSFGPGVANLLTVRLLKMPEWPAWRSLAVLIYLEEQKRPALTAALIRYVIETSDAQLVSAALDAILATEDPDLRAKITAERQQAEKRGRRLPKALLELERGKP